MTTVNTKIPFELLSNDEYISYIEKAEMLHEQGLLLDLSVIELAKKIHEKDTTRESKIN